MAAGDLDGVQAAGATSPGSPRASRPVSNWGMWVLALVLMVDQVDQNILRGAATPIQRAFHLSDFDLGALLACYTVANGIVSIPAGYLADRWVRRKAVARTLVAWSAITALTATAWNFGALLAIRTTLGFGQALSEPSSSSLLSDLYPLQRRGRAFAAQQCLSFVGLGLGLGLGGAVAAWAGWRAAFLLVGAPGVMISVAVWRLREPSRGESDFGASDATRPDRARFTLGGMVRDLAADYRTIARVKTLQFALVGVSALLFTVTAVASALPQFYEHQLGRSTAQAALFAGVLVVVAGIPGVIVGGRVGDRLALKIRGGRMAVPAACLLSGEAIFALSLAHLPFGAVYGLELIGTFVVTLAVPPLKAGISDALPPERRGSGFALFNIVSVIAGQAAAPVVVFSAAGALGGDYRTALLVVSPGVAAGAMVLFHARKFLDDDVARVRRAASQRASRTPGLRID
ncbi:MAG: MFS transporter [Acidimicrobiales bacterium]